jgi:hypothetical protein
MVNHLFLAALTFLWVVPAAVGFFSSSDSSESERLTSETFRFFFMMAIILALFSWLSFHHSSGL